jgi:hypothetical protein
VLTDFIVSYLEGIFKGFGGKNYLTFSFNICLVTSSKHLIAHSTLAHKNVVWQS